jgi:hypothetical protein
MWGTDLALDLALAGAPYLPSFGRCGAVDFALALALALVFALNLRNLETCETLKP